jgi:hypothetical protein
MDRSSFAAEFPYLFLFGEVGLDAPSGPAQSTLVIDNEQTLTNRASKRASEGKSPPVTVALPLRKRGRVFRTMITVGRTSNHDVVVAHASISKFHAFFRHQQKGSVDEIVLADAGSRNGTFINGTRLPTRGDAVRVQLGDLVRFSDIELTLIDAATLWDRVHADKSAL